MAGDSESRREIGAAVERLVDSLQVLVMLLPQVALQRDAFDARVTAAAQRALDDAAFLRLCCLDSASRKSSA